MKEEDLERLEIDENFGKGNNFSNDAPQSKEIDFMDIDEPEKSSGAIDLERKLNPIKKPHYIPTEQLI